MKVFSVCGFTSTGKTTTVEGIIKELKRRNYSVGSVKDIHFEDFRIDTQGSNTHRHRMAGAELVTARGIHETDILFPRQLNIYEIQAFYDVDYLVIEGMCDANIAHILTGKTKQDLENKYNERVFMISGKIADTITEYKGIPAISIFDDPKRMVDLIEEKTVELLPDFDEKCCGACGMDCRQFCASVIHENRDIRECVLYSSDVQMKINGQSIEMVPFVQKILKNAVIGVASELDGWTSNGKLEITIGRDYADR